jgi:MoaA/NifB/PqqE/SkfB family radical SAM enzyme
MVNITRLLNPDIFHKGEFPGDRIRYGQGKTPPVIVWHITANCNLRCRHCYAASHAETPAPMSGSEAFEFIGLLSALDPPALLMSGGEPLACPDFFPYLAKAVSSGIKVAVSTNGVLIDDTAAVEMARLGVSYAGVSLDGPGHVNDSFRGEAGAFGKAVKGIDALASNGCRVGLRVTLAKPLLPHLESIFDLALDLPVSRICFYHFIPAGRGASDGGLMPDHEEERLATSRIIGWADGLAGSGKGRGLEILTAGDPSDGVLTFEYLREREPDNAQTAKALLKRQAARRAPGILSVRWDGTVFLNQFSWDVPLGGWRDLAELKSPGKDGRFSFKAPDCRAVCRWRDICAGRDGRRCMAFYENAI